MLDLENCPGGVEAITPLPGGFRPPVHISTRLLVLLIYCDYWLYSVLDVIQWACYFTNKKNNKIFFSEGWMR